MDLSNLKPAKGSVHKEGKRLGRGEGSKKGGTSTKGTKGQQARTGAQKRFGHEGGQMPLVRRVPKFGFTNFNRKEYVPVNLSTLQYLSDLHKIERFDIEVFRNHGLIAKSDFVKILARGELTVKLDVTAHGFSKTAKEAIEKIGGTAKIIE